jgi:hypothetical protein
MTKPYIDESDLMTLESPENKMKRLEEEIHDTRIALMRSQLARITKAQTEAEKRRKFADSYGHPSNHASSEFDNEEFPAFTASDFA